MMGQQQQQQGSTNGDGQNQNQPTTLDMNTLAQLVQQFQGRQQKYQKTGEQSSPNQPPGLADALANATKDQVQQQQPAQGTDGTGAAEAGDTATSDPQAMMEQIAALTKSLETEKSKSKALQEEKKREMKGFLSGIRDYVNGLDGVKDPAAKNKFMQGMENMANHGIPNGVYDIMVSASARNDNNMRTIEALTKGYSELKDRYEGPGQFASESSRFVDPTIKVVDAGSKRKAAEQDSKEKVPLGMWDAFGEDVARVGYGSLPDLLSG